ncbi:MAG: hypothetical protein AB3N28_07430 [Kordiimonas sp.]
MSDLTAVMHTSNSHVTYKVGEMASTGTELYGAFFIDNPDSMQIDLAAMTITTWDGQRHDISGVDFLSFGNRGNDNGGVAHVHISEAAISAADGDNNTGDGSDIGDGDNTPNDSDSGSGPDDPMREGPVYSLSDNILFVGHSLVNIVMPEMVRTQIEYLGGVGSTEYQMTIGAPLQWNWNNPDSGQGVNARTHLAQGDTDVLVITEAVPLINHTEWSGSNEYASNYYNLAVASNPDVRVYLYETWHSNLSGTGVEVPYDANGHIPWRERLEQDLAKWEAIVDAVNEQRGEDEPEMLLIPAGQALGEVYDQVLAGNIPGITSEQEFFDTFFADDIHMSDLGNFFISMVQTATIYAVDPAEFSNTYDDEYGNTVVTVPDELMTVLQGIVSEVVTSYPHSGVSDSQDDDSSDGGDGHDTGSSDTPHIENDHVTYKVGEMGNSGAELYGAFFNDNPDSMQIDIEAMTVTTWDGAIHDISGMDFMSFGNRNNESGGVAHMYLSEEAASVAGDTISRGGEGSDLFVFAAHHGNSVVTAFDVNEDQLYLANTFVNFTDLDSLLEASENTELNGSAGVLIQTGEGNSIFLEDVTMSALTAENFVTES